MLGEHGTNRLPADGCGCGEPPAQIFVDLEEPGAIDQEEMRTVLRLEQVDIRRVRPLPGGRCAGARAREGVRHRRELPDDSQREKNGMPMPSLPSSSPTLSNSFMAARAAATSGFVISSLSCPAKR